MKTKEVRTAAEFNRLIQHGVALVDFYAPWCAPCRAQAPVIEDLCDAYARQAAIGKVDVERVRETARTFGVMSIPTLILFCNGREIDRFIGLQRRETLARSIESALSLSASNQIRPGKGNHP
jgi:thioredoxin 1